MNDEVKKQGRLDYLEEGRKVRQRIEDERLKVERIKKEKLAGIVDLGIAEKYQADLAKKRILWMKIDRKKVEVREVKNSIKPLGWLNS